MVIAQISQFWRTAVEGFVGNIAFYAVARRGIAHQSLIDVEYGLVGADEQHGAGVAAHAAETLEQHALGKAHQNKHQKQQHGKPKQEHAVGTRVDERLGHGIGEHSKDRYQRNGLLDDFVGCRAALVHHR